MKKILFALCFSMFTTAAMACTDFSGRYRDEDSALYTVSQSGCASITVSSSTGEGTIITDGQFRITDEDEQVRVYTAASFIGVTLTIENRLEFKVPLPPEIPADSIPVKIILVYSKDSAGNLLITTTLYNSNGQVLGSESSTHPRV